MKHKMKESARSLVRKFLRFSRKKNSTPGNKATAQSHIHDASPAKNVPEEMFSLEHN